MDSRIIDEIVREVLARMQTARDDAKETKALAIVANQVADPVAAINTLQKNFPGIRYAVLQPGFEGSGIERLRGEELLDKNLTAAAGQCEHVVLVAPALWMLENIARGDDRGFVEFLILRSILWEKKVHILLDFMLPRFKRNTLYERTQNAVESLKGMGLDFMQYGTQNNHEEALSLVTEKEIIEASEQGKARIVCAAGAIVTPAARDRASELNIKIER